MKFNNKDPKYKVVKITNIILIIIFGFAEIIAQELQGVNAPNAAPVFITFLISRYFIRNLFTKNPDFDYKIIKTIGVWLSVMVVKGILLTVLLSLI